MPKPVPKPTVHYDYMMGSMPRWREAILSALKGHPDLLRMEYLAMAGWAASACHLLRSCYDYAKSGQQVFCVGPRLQEMLHLTDLSVVPEVFLEVPFQCFYVALPECGWSIWGGEVTQWHPVTGAYVSRVGPVFTFVLWGKENSRSTCVGDDATYWIQVNLEEAQGEKGSLDLKSLLRRQLNDIRRDHSDLLAPKAKTGPVHERHTGSVLSVLRVLFNLVLYLNSSDPEKTAAPRNNKSQREELKKKLKRAKSASKRRKYQNRLSELSEAQVVWIGRSIEEGKIPNRTTKTGQSHKGRPVKPHWRKGHFHSYWVGPRKDAEGNRQKGDRQVLRWVAPVFVGDMASLVAARGRIFMFAEDHKES